MRPVRWNSSSIGRQPPGWFGAASGFDRTMSPTTSSSTGIRPRLVLILVPAPESRGIPFGADWLGKLKMALQCAAGFALFLALAMPSEALALIRASLVWAMLAATVLSGAQYVVRAARSRTAS